MSRERASRKDAGIPPAFVIPAQAGIHAPRDSPTPGNGASPGNAGVPPTSGPPPKHGAGGVSIAPAIAEHYPELIESQRAVVGHLDGPLLVIAGPGSGKTFSIVLRALGFLLPGKAVPKEIVLCTFTGDLRVYGTCPRQYRFFREHDFTPSRSAAICRECDLRALCRAEGIIGKIGEPETLAA